MKKTALLMAMVILVLTLSSLGAAGTTGPGQFDWSSVKVLMTVNPYELQPPVHKDIQGNYHIFMPVIEETFMGINYFVVNPGGNTLQEVRHSLQNYTPDSLMVGVSTQKGAFIFWTTPDSNRVWRLYSMQINPRGEAADTREVDLAFQGELVSHPADYSELRRVLRLNADVGPDGDIHLSIVGGGAGMHRRFHYLRYTPELELITSNSTIRWSSMVADGNRAHAGGQVIGLEDGAWVIGDSAGHSHLTWFGISGQRREFSLPEAAFVLGGSYSNVYTTRRIGPVMAIDKDGILHYVYNHVTRHPGIGPQIIDVAYGKVLNGRVIEERIISNQQGIAHFPTLTIQDDKVYIAWEEGQGSSYELYFSVLETSGETVIPRTRLTWEQAPSRLGWIFGDGDGNLQAFWWRPAGDRMDYLAFKTTLDPVPPSVWLKLGLNPYDLDNSLLGQVLYYSAMVFMAGLARVVTNLHILLYVVLIIFVLHKLQVLDPLMERPWTLFILLLMGLYLALPSIDSVGATFPLTAGFQLYAGLSAGLLTVLVFGLLKVRPNTTLNIMLGCLIWLVIVSMIHLIPIVPQQFVL